MTARIAVGPWQIVSTNAETLLRSDEYVGNEFCYFLVRSWSVLNKVCGFRPRNTFHGDSLSFHTFVGTDSVFEVKG